MMLEDLSWKSFDTFTVHFVKQLVVHIYNVWNVGMIEIGRYCQY